jgi:hypothetical protein
MDIKAKKSADEKLSIEQLFSSMPPLEAFMFMVSLFITWSRAGSPAAQAAGKKKPYKLALFDISRAHFYGKAKREVYVDLVEEDKDEFGHDKCGLLLRSMYGTQDASCIWQEDYVELLTSGGYRRGISNGAVFFHPELDCRVTCHGDDFMVLGDDDAIASFEALIASRYQYKRLAILGFEPKDDKSMTYLNRVVRVAVEANDRRVVYVEPDSRHALLIVKDLGLEGSKGVDTPAEKKSSEQQMADAESPQLYAEEALRYRSVTMRSAYLAQDRPDLSNTTKGLARHMQQPTTAAMGRLKRLGRYLINHPSVVRRFDEQKLPDKIKVLVDSDHAGCAVTRRSTTGMIVRFGRHCCKHSGNLQTGITLSSGESEYGALVKGASTGLGIQSLLADLGLDVQVEVLSDSSAARGHVARRGLGKMRHIQTRYLWVQERVGEGHLKIACVLGTKNPADICTKSVPATAMFEHMRQLGFEYGVASKVHKKLL